MIHSMTGYGRFEDNDSNYDVIVEVKSLNSRYLEVLPKIHESLYKYENNIISLVRKACKRGKVYLNINLIENTRAMPHAHVYFFFLYFYSVQRTSIESKCLW